MLTSYGPLLGRGIEDSGLLNALAPPALIHMAGHVVKPYAHHLSDRHTQAAREDTGSRKGIDVRIFFGERLQGGAFEFFCC